MYKLEVFLSVCLAALALHGEAWSGECEGSPGLRASIKSEDDRECSIEHVSVFQAFRVVDGVRQESPTSKFKVGDRVVLCITMPFDAYVSVWDAPPQGNRERLFPNTHSHSPGVNGHFASSGSETCIGSVGSGYEVEISVEEGLGRGQFYLLATRTLQQQLGADEFTVPEYGLSASIVTEKGVPVGSLTGFSDTWLIYQVEQR